jgi:hypothetical protein
VKLSTKVTVDSLGAIFLAKYKNACERTKHVDSKYPYVREFIKDNFSEVVFVTSEENIADIFTMNLDVRGFELHQSKLFDGFDSTLKEGYQKSCFRSRMIDPFYDLDQAIFFKALCFFNL